MKSLHEYVPKKSYKLTFHLPEEDFVTDENSYHRILLGGDQLTTCRSPGARSARRHDNVTSEHFDGLIPVTEDWHARMTLMRVEVISDISLVYWYAVCYFYRLFGNDFSPTSQQLIKQHRTNLKIC